jgi:arabinose-5-phosphate isomerase
MHAGDALPSVAAATPMSQVIYEMSRKKLGVTTVLDGDGTLIGLISDGDLRRLLEGRGPSALTLTAGDAMNPRPHTIAADELAARGLAIMEERRITSLVVTSHEQRALGILHLHDLWGLELM